MIMAIVGILRLLPLVVVLPITEALVGLESTDRGCWLAHNNYARKSNNANAATTGVLLISSISDLTMGYVVLI